MKVQDFETPRGRRAFLGGIAPPVREVAEKYHSELLEIFRREIEYRNSNAAEEDPDEDGLEYFENIYWCAFLLFMIGDVNDVPLLWTAKTRDMDIGCGMEWQFLVGAGIDRTLQFARSKKMDDLVAYLGGCCKSDTDSLAILDWAVYRCFYFYRRQI